jgi:hypothetical protein
VVVVLPFAWGRRRHAVEPAQHQQLLAERLERHERRREREVRARGRREPLAGNHAIGRVDGLEAQAWFRRRLLERGERRHHRVEEGQRQGHAEGLERRAARERFLRDDHEAVLPI